MLKVTCIMVILVLAFDGNNYVQPYTIVSVHYLALG